MIVIHVGTNLGSLYGSFDGSHDVNIEGSLLEESLGSTFCLLLGSDECIKNLSTDRKVLVTLLGNVYGMTLGIYVGTWMESLDGSFHGINGDKLNALLLKESLDYTDGKVIGSNEDIQLGSTDGKVLGNVLGNVDGITLGTDVVTKTF